MIPTGVYSTADPADFGLNQAPDHRAPARR
jgi:hypothetical protein